MTQKHKETVAAFIEAIWNRQDWAQLEQFLHPAYQDHSLPPALLPGPDGLQQWVQATSAAFKHTTYLEDLLAEGDRCVAKIRMEMEHIGLWRGIAPTGMAVQTSGYRQFRLQDGKIIEAWALIDGQTLENQLRQTAHGCVRMQ